jgi:hypothetical protein
MAIEHLTALFERFILVLFKPIGTDPQQKFRLRKNNSFFSPALLRKEMATDIFQLI